MSSKEQSIKRTIPLVVLGLSVLVIAVYSSIEGLQKFSEGEIIILVFYVGFMIYCIGK